jgi:hypothetical protein
MSILEQRKVYPEQFHDHHQQHEHRRHGMEAHQSAAKTDSCQNKRTRYVSVDLLSAEHIINGDQVQRNYLARG